MTLLTLLLDAQHRLRPQAPDALGPHRAVDRAGRGDPRGDAGLNKGLKASVQEGVNPLADLADLLVGNGQTGVPADLAGPHQGDEPARRRRAPRRSSSGGSRMPTLDNKVVWLIGVDDKKAGGKDALAAADSEQARHPRRARLEPKTLARTGPASLARAARRWSRPNLARELAAAQHAHASSCATPAARRPSPNFGTIDFSRAARLPFKDSSRRRHAPVRRLAASASRRSRTTSTRSTSSSSRGPTRPRSSATLTERAGRHRHGADAWTPTGR